ncbi:MAG: DUF4139 domain-containing protein [Polyangia bacterium]
MPRTTSSIALSSFLGIASLLSGCASTAVSRGPELPVTRAVLYQNGIGYFERRGKLSEDVLHLRVRPDQIRDFLKSLTVVDLGSGRATSIALPVEKSRAQTLTDLPEQVRTEGGLLAIAQAFRGARVVVDGERRVVGRLVGVENLGGAPKNDWRLSVLTDGGALAQLSVEKIKDIKILDGTLEVGLKKALDAALDAGSWKSVDVTVRLAGGGTHDLVVSYVVEMPAWKPAYRLVIDDKAQGRSLLQGWAVVDNLSGDDWKNISLSLTAGTPLAFTYDLYTPRMPRRPHLEARDEISQVPLDAFQSSGGIASTEQSRDDADRAPMEESIAPPSVSTPSMAPAKSKKAGLESEYRRGARADAAMAPPPPPRPPAAVTSADLERNFRTLVAGSTVGSLFRYDIAEPITVAERQSALVNVINAKVAGEDALLFRVGQDQVSPYRVVRFANDSGFVLESGPIAIYRSGEGGGTFLGEALAQRIEKGASTFLPYALDGRVRVQLSEEDREEGVQLLRIVHGVITCETKRVTRWKYDVDNGTGEATTMYVRRDRRPGWKVVGQSKMVEEGGAYFVPIALPKSGRTKVEVEEQTPVRRDVDIWDDYGRQVIGLYLKGANVDPKVAPALKEILALRERVDRIEAQLATAEEQRQAQSERQGEVRENLKALGKSNANADLKRKLETTLGELETGLNDVTRRTVQLSIDRSEARDRLSVLIKNIDMTTVR